MNDFNLKDIINSREAFIPSLQKKREPRIDKSLSEALGKKIVSGTADHRKAIRVIAKWNNQRDSDDLRSIDYLKDQSKIKELKRALN